MEEDRQVGLDVVEFGPLLSDWDTRIRAMAYYVYGEILSESALIERLDRADPRDHYLLKQADLAFTLINTLTKRQGSFTFGELLKEFRRTLGEWRTSTVTFAHLHSETGKLEWGESYDLDEEMVLDDDIELLQRALFLVSGYAIIVIPPEIVAELRLSHSHGRSTARSISHSL